MKYVEGPMRPTYPHRTGRYTRSPLEDSRLFGPSPWKILATTYERKTISEQRSPWRKSSKRESCYGDRVYVIAGAVIAGVGGGSSGSQDQLESEAYS